MKPPSKPFFVEVRRSRSIPAQAAPPPPRPTPSWEDAPEPAGARSKAWQHAEQFFQARPATPPPEQETSRQEPVPVPPQAAIERRDEPDDVPRADAKPRDAAETRSGAGRGRKSVRAAARAADDKPAEVPPAKRRRTKEATARPVGTVPLFVPEPAAAAPKADPGSADKGPVSSPVAFVGEDDVEMDGRKPLSARAARSAAKPAERWTCRLRHVRRNLGAGRIGQPRP